MRVAGVLLSNELQRKYWSRRGTSNIHCANLTVNIHDDSTSKFKMTEGMHVYVIYRIQRAMFLPAASASYPCVFINVQYSCNISCWNVRDGRGYTPDLDSVQRWEQSS